MSGSSQYRFSWVTFSGRVDLTCKWLSVDGQDGSALEGSTIIGLIRNTKQLEARPTRASDVTAEGTTCGR